jgi:zinc transporter, ZIP family
VSTEAPQAQRAPAWILAAIPISLLAILALLLLAFDLPGLDRNGPAIEKVAVERTELRPGVIELRVRNDGPDPVQLAQVIVNDAFIAEASIPSEPIGRLGQATVRIPYLWNEGEAYEISLLTSTGVTVAHAIEAAAETPKADASFFGLLGLLGLYVGLIPVLMGMLWLPFARRASDSVVRFLLAVTVGLLAFLAVEAVVEGVDAAGQGAQSFGGASLVALGAFLAYVAMTGVDGWLSRRRAGADGWRVALLVAIGIGLHNFGEGLAIGGAYAAGALALGAFLVIGFAVHNTTEGLAIVAPIARERPSLRSLALLGAIAGLPVVPGAWIGGLASNPQVTALLLGVGAGAIVQVIQQILPALRPAGTQRGLEPLIATGLGAGLILMWGTSLLAA